MTDLLLIIDRLVANALNENEIDDLTDQLVYWVQNTAAHARRDLLTASPAERLNLPPGQFPEHTMLRVAESYADSFYPEEFDKYRDTLADLKPGAPRLKVLRWRFIDWLKATWKREDAERPFYNQMPESDDDQPDTEPSVDGLSSLSVDGTREERERATFLEHARQAILPLEAWTERHRDDHRWQPAINLLRSTAGRLEIELLPLSRQRLEVPSQQDLNDAWFRALSRLLCRRTGGMTFLSLADELGIAPDRVDYLIKLEDEFQRPHHPKS